MTLRRVSECWGGRNEEPLIIANNQLATFIGLHPFAIYNAFKLLSREVLFLKQIEVNRSATWIATMILRYINKCC